MLPFPVPYLSGMTGDTLINFGHAINSEAQLLVIRQHAGNVNGKLRELCAGWAATAAGSARKNSMENDRLYPALATGCKAAARVNLRHCCKAAIGYRPLGHLECVVYPLATPGLSGWDNDRGYAANKGISVSCL